MSPTVAYKKINQLKEDNFSLKKLNFLKKIYVLLNKYSFIFNNLDISVYFVEKLLK